MIVSEYLFDIKKCKANVDEQAENFMHLAIKELELTAVSDLIVHDFKPHGKTVTFILSESHILLHTFPEYKSIMLDFFPCHKQASPKSIELLTSLIERVFKTKNISYQRIKRKL